MVKKRMEEVLKKIGSWLFLIGILLSVIIGIIYGANLWTADSPDPFDGEVDEDEVSDHQLNRLGALMREAVPEHERGLVERATAAAERAMDFMAARPDHIERNTMEDMIMEATQAPEPMDEMPF